MSNSAVSKETFTFVWKIKNLYPKAFRIGEGILSYTFSLTNFQCTKWNLEFYPRGHGINCIDYACCILQRVDVEGPDSIVIEYDILANSNGGNYSFRSQSFEKRKSVTCDKLLHMNEINKAKESLTITCVIRSSNEISPDITPLTNSFLLLCLQSQNIASEVLLTKRSLVAFPTKCIMQSQLRFDKTVIVSPVDIYFVNGSVSKQVIPALLSKFCFVITLSKKSASDEFITVTLRNINPLFLNNLIVICQISVLVNDSKLVCLDRETLVFCPGGDYELYLEGSIKNSDLQNKLKECPMNSLSWNFELKFGSKEVQSEVIWEECNNMLCCPEKSVLLNKLGQCTNGNLYTDQDPFDFVFKVNEKSFPAHKVVLAAFSPVFEAMFRSDMAESASNTVTIEDFDEDVVEELVAFFYSGAVKDLDFDRALMLFVIADKYQVLPLMMLCRTFLIKNLNVENFCSVLTLADKCNDETLQKACVQFVSYESEVFKSSEWATFEKENLAFANKIFREVFLLHNYL